MTPERHHRLMELFDAACELSDGDARAFLEGLAPDDGDLRDELASMLQADHRPAGVARPGLSARELIERALRHTK